MHYERIRRRKTVEVVQREHVIHRNVFKHHKDIRGGDGVTEGKVQVIKVLQGSTIILTVEMKTSTSELF